MLFSSYSVQELSWCSWSMLELGPNIILAHSAHGRQKKNTKKISTGTGIVELEAEKHQGCPQTLPI